MLLLLEAALALAAVAVSFAIAGVRSRLLDRVESAFCEVARYRRLAVLLVGASALLARAALLTVLPVPTPRVDDEFSHLLLADTLLHGRLANPTPPMWIHLEAIEVIMQPTYASVYQPMQALFLAAGRVLCGSPFVGVMLSVVLMCAAICWMLQGFMPAEWALLGGLLVATRYGVFTYWANGYMGGAPAAIGGALVVGAFFRIKKNPQIRYGLILGLGMAVLANSRPYEGFVLCVVVGVAFLHWLFTKIGQERRDAWLYVFAPMLLVLALAGLSDMYYCWRVTGNPFRTPYQLVWQAYGMTPKFLWQTLRPQQGLGLRHPALAHFYYVWETSSYESTRTFRGLLAEWATRLVVDWTFYLGPLLTLPLFAAVATTPYGFRLRQLEWSTKFLLVCTAIFAVGLGIEVFSYPHYAAPILCIVVALVLLAIRHVRQQSYRGNAFGVWLSRLILLSCLLVLALRATSGPLHIPLRPAILPLIYNSVRNDVSSAAVEASLDQLPGQHLVIVHYRPGTDDWMGWVHNEADIDHSKIVWAWDMGTEKNQELLDYFRGRQVWVVDSSEHPPVPRAYPSNSDR